VPFSSEEILRLCIAVLIGGLIGTERELRDKAAGFRTIIFITVGAALFTMLSTRLGGPESPDRIAASIVSGVGFLGAGTILRDRGRVVGLTTASTIWLVAALGMCVGGGYLALAAAATALVLTILIFFPRLEERLDRASEVRTYEVISPLKPDLFGEFDNLIRCCGLRVGHSKKGRTGDRMICTWDVFGPPQGHEELARKLLVHPDVQEFRA